MVQSKATARDKCVVDLGRSEQSLKRVEESEDWGSKGARGGGESRTVFGVQKTKS